MCPPATLWWAERGMMMKPLRKLLSLAALLGCPFLLWKLAYWYDNRRALALRKEVYRKPR